jgi:glutamyl-tRNA synthetase
MEPKVRVRFAPSPTGPLHIGGVRTALYNYLFARKLGGDFLLRIEDTDQTRFVEGAEQYIIESLNWLGITFDEGVHVGGKHAPYRQSERKHLYRQYADMLIASGDAYYAFDSSEKLDELRKEAEAAKKNFQYDSLTRNNLVNSLTLSADETQAKLDAGEPYVIRFKIPENIDVELNDLIRGHVCVHSTSLDDKVLYKSDGMPTYHLANVVDDYLMEITHVIRGEEWLPSAPLHVLLYEKFGWKNQMPQFAHLPLLLKPDGNGKLSKRDGDRLGFPVFPLQWKDPKTNEISSGYRESGYFPDAVVNILALLGWNPGNNQELLSMDDLINLFSLDKISKAGAKFDLEKSKWFNHQYLINRADQDLATQLLPLFEAQDIHPSIDKLAKIIGLVKERVQFVKELVPQTIYFFKAPESYNDQVIKKRWKEDTPMHLTQIATIISSVQPFDKISAHDKVAEYIQSAGLNMGQIMNCLRLSLVGDAMGPDLFEIVELLGTDEVSSRINTSIEKISI